MKKLIIFLSLLIISSCSMYKTDDNPYPHGKPLNEYPGHYFEVVAKINNSVTNEEEKFNYFTHIVLLDNGVEIDSTKNIDEYKNSVAIGLREYIVNDKINTDNPVDNWNIEVNELTEIFIDEKEFEDLKKASNLLDDNNLCWENMSGSLLKNDEVITQNLKNGFAMTGATIFEKYQSYIPKECEKKE